MLTTKAKGHALMAYKTRATTTSGVLRVTQETDVYNTHALVSKMARTDHAVRVVAAPQQQ